MKLIIASNNAHKVLEIKQILGDTFSQVVSLKEAGCTVEIEETGKTFEENAMIKAVGIQNLFPDCAVLADDSGIEVDALNGEPGVKSARYAFDISCHGEGDADKANNIKLLNLMQDVADDKRSCRFVACIALIFKDKTTIQARGTCEGEVLRTLKGEGGFGYDPLFYIKSLNKTYAELTSQEKNAISHRGKALASLKVKLDEKQN